MPRRNQPSDSPAQRARLAAHLGIKPTEAEAAAGYKTPASLILDVGRRDDAWVVVLRRGHKHVIPDAELAEGKGTEGKGTEGKGTTDTTGTP